MSKEQEHKQGRSEMQYDVLNILKDIRTEYAKNNKQGKALEVEKLFFDIKKKISQL
tara:strand:+ start:2103 stop:2270 length:168 start_codon:yes stop_codon:yes gene_type:complete